LIVHVFEEKRALGTTAATHAAEAIARAIQSHGVARIVAATGASQFEFLDALSNNSHLDWRSVELFQLDEYVGLPMTHPASFTRYINERLVSRTGIARYHALDGSQNPLEMIRRASDAINAAPVDLAFAGIGENAHLAFNDPPANFATDDPYIIVNLDEACRRQQVGEGWFADLASVPRQAISMSIKQILRAREIISVVPDKRKAAAVKACLEGPISPMAPASILRTHSNAKIYLDTESASSMSAVTLAAFHAGSTQSARETHAPQTAGRGE
jgi:glucosamine-6-phosphate deaminase